MNLAERLTQALRNLLALVRVLPGCFPLVAVFLILLVALVVWLSLNPQTSPPAVASGWRYAGPGGMGNFITLGSYKNPSDPSAPEVLMVGADVAGLFVSVDAGASWRNVTEYLDKSSAVFVDGPETKFNSNIIPVDVVFDSAGSAYVATESGVHRSEPGNYTAWTQVHAVPTSAIHLSPTTGNAYFGVGHRQKGAAHFNGLGAEMITTGDTDIYVYPLSGSASPFEIDLEPMSTERTWINTLDEVGDDLVIGILAGIQRVELATHAVDEPPECPPVAGVMLCDVVALGASASGTIFTVLGYTDPITSDIGSLWVWDGASDWGKLRSSADFVSDGGILKSLAVADLGNGRLGIATGGERLDTQMCIAPEADILADALCQVSQTSAASVGMWFNVYRTQYYTDPDQAAMDQDGDGVADLVPPLTSWTRHCFWSAFYRGSTTGDDWDLGLSLLSPGTLRLRLLRVTGLGERDWSFGSASGAAITPVGPFSNLAYTGPDNCSWTLEHAKGAALVPSDPAPAYVIGEPGFPGRWTLRGRWKSSGLDLAAALDLVAVSDTSWFLGLGDSTTALSTDDGGETWSRDIEAVNLADTSLPNGGVGFNRLIHYRRYLIGVRAWVGGTAVFRRSLAPGDPIWEGFAPPPSKHRFAAEFELSETDMAVDRAGRIILAVRSSPVNVIWRTETPEPTNPNWVRYTLPSATPIVRWQKIDTCREWPDTVFASASGPLFPITPAVNDGAFIFQFGPGEAMRGERLDPNPGSFLHWGLDVHCDPANNRVMLYVGSQTAATTVISKYLLERRAEKWQTMQQWHVDVQDSAGASIGVTRVRDIAIDPTPSASGRRAAAGLSFANKPWYRHGFIAIGGDGSGGLSAVFEELLANGLPLTNDLHLRFSESGSKLFGLHQGGVYVRDNPWH